MSSLNDLNKKISLEIALVKHNDITDVNKVKEIKNDMYQKASLVFLHNLKILIMIESTQKKLAKKIGISEDLLSKYKSGAAFPSIETLLYISEIYNIKLNDFLTKPLSINDFSSDNNDPDNSIFEDKYYAYFLVTNIGKKGVIHEGTLSFDENRVNFKILKNTNILKSFDGLYHKTGRIISIELKSNEDGNAYINMIKPSLNKKKYVGGIALLMLPSDANSKPCCQKIIISKYKINRSDYNSDLLDFLKFHNKNYEADSMKLSVSDDEIIYNFLQSNFSS
ncbi:MAG: helix-turn-helix transcriptional regulator [Inconstantimicrobium porci]|uniref:helix-turn-helix domain-containing protein n=1 Tax=Inconstantimicrobium porci TaxID=2652291 RepID=UPI001F39D1BF|nr:helix-turn-helix transcriptional regulator [Inconstantimicrobium porci]MDY5911601.1 helix-turn-helix transcriptional regulator [Inconstantimicrobium porci]